MRLTTSAVEASAPAEHGERVDVPDDRIFTGLDGYKKALEVEGLVSTRTGPTSAPARARPTASSRRSTDWRELSLAPESERSGWMTTARIRGTAWSIRWEAKGVGVLSLGRHPRA